MADEKTSLEERLMADIASFSCQVCGQQADDWRVTYGIEGAVPTVRCSAHPIDDFVTRERQEQKQKDDLAKAGEHALDLLEELRAEGLRLSEDYYDRQTAILRLAGRKGE